MPIVFMACSALITCGRLVKNGTKVEVDKNIGSMPVFAETMLSVTGPKALVTLRGSPVSKSRYSLEYMSSCGFKGTASKLKRGSTV